MPSKLPIIKANTTQENINKMKVIADTNKRSVAKELEWLIENHIKNYEKEYGEIDYEQFKNQQVVNTINTIAEKLYKTMLESEKMGKKSAKQALDEYKEKALKKGKIKEQDKLIIEYIERRIKEDEKE